MIVCQYIFVPVKDASTNGLGAPRNASLRPVRSARAPIGIGKGFMRDNMTERHPGYSSALSAEENVRRGRKYDGGQSYKRVAAQLQEQANFRSGKNATERERKEGARFRAAAKEARRLEDKVRA